MEGTGKGTKYLRSGVTSYVADTRISGYTVVVTETLTSSLMASALTAVPVTWGFWDCCRLATAAEMADAHQSCARCATVMTAKVGSGTVAGRMIGRRAWPTDDFDWEGPFCQKCNRALGEAEGYGAD
jgi:hypothetical protein